ncbi:MAG: DUF2141 domain-containing protein [Rhodospirillales bacterium]
MTVPLRLPALFLLFLSASAPALAADLVVKVAGLRSSRGDVHVAVYATEESFPGDTMAAETHVPITGENAEAVFLGLDPGTYAVAVYHDENANHEFDQGWFYIPLEGYAFSNGATVFFGPPGFDEAAFSLGRQGGEITIIMGY